MKHFSVWLLSEKDNYPHSTKQIGLRPPNSGASTSSGYAGTIDTRDRISGISITPKAPRIPNGTEALFVPKCYKQKTDNVLTLLRFG